MGGLWSLVLGLWSGGGEEDEAMGSGIRKDEGGRGRGSKGQRGRGKEEEKKEEDEDERILECGDEGKVFNSLTFELLNF